MQIRIATAPQNVPTNIKCRYATVLLRRIAVRAVVFRKIPVLLLAAVFLLLPLLMGRTVLLGPLLGTR